MPSVSCPACGKEFQSEESLQQHAQSKHGTAKTTLKKERTGSRISTTKIAMGIAVLVVIAVGAWLVLSPTTPAGPGKYDDFAKCLSQKGVVMYGAYWCQHCANQKKLFGDSFQFVNYVECDAGGPNPQPALCAQKGITGYPTWIYDGESRNGEQSLQSLGDWASCPLTP